MNYKIVALREMELEQGLFNTAEVQDTTTKFDELLKTINKLFIEISHLAGSAGIGAIRKILDAAINTAEHDYIQKLKSTPPDRILDSPIEIELGNQESWITAMKLLQGHRQRLSSEIEKGDIGRANACPKKGDLNSKYTVRDLRELKFKGLSPVYIVNEKSPNGAGGTRVVVYVKKDKKGDYKRVKITPENLIKLERNEFVPEKELKKIETESLELTYEQVNRQFTEAKARFKHLKHILDEIPSIDGTTELAVVEEAIKTFQRIGKLTKQKKTQEHQDYIDKCLQTWNENETYLKELSEVQVIQDGAFSLDMYHQTLKEIKKNTDPYFYEIWKKSITGDIKIFFEKEDKERTEDKAIKRSQDEFYKSLDAFELTPEHLGKSDGKPLTEEEKQVFEDNKRLYQTFIAPAKLATKDSLDRADFERLEELLSCCKDAKERRQYIFKMPEEDNLFSEEDKHAQEMTNGKSKESGGGGGSVAAAAVADTDAVGTDPELSATFSTLDISYEDIGTAIAQIIANESKSDSDIATELLYIMGHSKEPSGKIKNTDTITLTGMKIKHPLNNSDVITKTADITMTKMEFLTIIASILMITEPKHSPHFALGSIKTLKLIKMKRLSFKDIFTKITFDPGESKFIKYDGTNPIGSILTPYNTLGESYNMENKMGRNLKNAAMAIFKLALAAAATTRGSESEEEIVKKITTVSEAMLLDKEKINQETVLKNKGSTPGKQVEQNVQWGNATNRFIIAKYLAILKLAKE